MCVDLKQNEWSLILFVPLGLGYMMINMLKIPPHSVVLYIIILLHFTFLLHYYNKTSYSIAKLLHQ
jgi:hypothetical protein